MSVVRCGVGRVKVVLPRVHTDARGGAERSPERTGQVAQNKGFTSHFELWNPIPTLLLTLAG